MASSPTIKQLNTENLPAFGEVLQHRFIVGYPDLVRNAEFDNPSWWKNQVYPAIVEVYKSLGMDITALSPAAVASNAGVPGLSEDVIKAKVSLPELPVPVLKPTDYRVADVIKTSDNHYYVVTGLVGGAIRTFPQLRYPDSTIIDPLSPTTSHEAFRPNLANVDQEVINNFIIDTIPEILEQEGVDSGTFGVNRLVGEDSGNLQIGDLIFAVDPIQISFSTQNGYEFFPTLRTNGQPKLPTMQQIKNIHVVLIFPNEDSINNQLIPLYAMFRRTPFVNIKNKDIRAFFQDIESPNGWIPVALEGIHIQSVDGFPNSLQAELSLLPFESRFLGGSGFKALKSMNDVYLQQKYSYDNTSEDYLEDTGRFNLRNEGTISERWEQLVNPGVQSTENFKESLPFRAFYQSMIDGRKTVKDEFGFEEKLITKNEINTFTSRDISSFAPTRSENKLREYKASHNNGLLSFRYRYVQGDLQELQRAMSFQELDRSNERLDATLTFIDKVQDYKGLANVMFSSFHTYKDALRDFEYNFGRSENIVNQVLALHGYDTTVVEPPTLDGVPVVGSIVKKVPLGTIFDFIYRSLLHSTGVSQFYTAFRTLSQQDINSFENNNSAVYDLLQGQGLLYNDVNIGEVSTYGIKSIDQAFRELWRWIEEDDTGTRKRDMFLIMNNIAERIKGELDTAIVPLAGDDESNTVTYGQRRLPIVSEDVVIDNMQDVITNWSLTYSNKFVPFSLESFKYPFYQHLGSNDAQIGLRITSVEGPNDLKANLSKMSDKIYDSVKLIMHHAPDLYTWLDPRVEIVTQPNHFLYAFGIRSVIMNSTNSTNIQGRPNAWGTTVNLTQAHFNLDQYHSLEYKPNTADIEAVLTRLLPRIKNGGDYTFNHPRFGKVITNTEDLIVKKYLQDENNIEMLLFMSFIDSPAGHRFLEHFHEVLRRARLRETTDAAGITRSGGMSGRELAEQIQSKLDQIASIDIKELDSNATTALQAVIKQYPRFGEIMKAVSSSYEELLERQADALINLIDLKQSKVEIIMNEVFEATLTNIAAEAGTILLLVLVSAIIPGGFLLALGTKAAIVGLRGFQIVRLIEGALDAGAQIAFSELRDRMSLFFSNMVANYKREILLNLAHTIVKDPPIREVLLHPAIVYAGRDPGNEPTIDLRALMRRREEASVFQCYKDFDIPVTKQIGTDKQHIIKLSPDFYLLSPEESKIHATTFVRDNTERLLKTGKLSMMSTLVDHKRLVERFDSLLNSLGVERDEEGNANLSAVDQFGFSSINKIAKELNYEGNLERSYIEITRRYNAIVNQDADIRSTGDLNVNVDRNTLTSTNFIDQAKIESYMKEYDAANSERDQSSTAYKRERNFIETYLNIGVAPKIENRDLLKLNFIWAQRMMTLIEILEIYSAIVAYLAQQPIFEEDIDKNQVAEIFKKLAQEDNKQLLGGSKNAIEEMRRHVGVILKNFDVIRSDKLQTDSDTVTANNRELSDSDKKAYEELLGKYDQGVYRGSKENSTLSLPEIRILQNHLYNKIGYYIRLNTVIDHYNGQVANGKAPRINLDTLPEIKFLDYWNVRAAEANFRKLEIMKEYVNSLKRRKRPTMRMFPTFKLFFIEEDGVRTQLLDDYYAYNAVQSIEIIKNKSMASTTAVIRLSNIMGTITDQFAFHREGNEFTQSINPDIPDDVFFGTLDVKPGTRVQIKLGYSADERELDTVFNGRIIEMNAGPITEMVCQSFGAQLNHEVYAHKFGLLASEKEHGDIASAILDMIPGLEMLGNKDVINLGLVSGFSGKDLKKIRKNLFDKYLMSNIFGRTSASLTNSDNPRDENIYLPFDLSTYPDWKPTFSWVVYQQSVWDAIREIALYHRNVCTVIRPYNTDSVSTRADQRETLVIGDKSGYYKYTDSYGLSSLDTDKIQERVDQWSDILSSNVLSDTGLVPSFVDRANRASPNSIKNFFSLERIGHIYEVFTNVELFDPNTLAAGGTAYIDNNSVEFIKSANIKGSFKEAWDFLSDKLNVTILSKHLTDNLDIEIRSLGDLAKEAVASKIKAFGTPIETAIDVMHKFADGSNFGDPTVNKVTNSNKLRYFMHIIYIFNFFKRANLQDKFGRAGPGFWNLSPEQFYGVRLAVDNKSKTLINDPRYRKIQQHHLVSDSLNLLSNNITLNASFANMVNLWYLDNPDYISSDGVPPDKWEDLNVWTTKAFRDTRDEHSRPLHSFQKNINSSWKDIATANNDFFGGYKRIMVDAMEEKNSNSESKTRKAALAGHVKNLNPDFGSFNINTPDWRMFPSYVLVGINLLKQQVETMYRGTIQLVGDMSIEPMDIVHLQDYTNDIHGPIEVEEVIHTFTPDNGLRTTITPCLITYDRDPIQLEDVGVINRIYDRALKNRAFQIGKGVLGVGLTVGGIINAVWGSKALALEMGVVGLPLAYNGIMGSTVRYHRFLYEQMGNILGGDVLNFTALIRKGAPFICGFDGLDYASLKTVINHQVESVDGFINRLSSFGDPFSAVVNTNWDAQSFGPAKLLAEKSGWSRIASLPNNGSLNDAFSFWDMLNPLSDFNGF